MDARLQEHIFEPFKRGDGRAHGWGGVGLGLYIVNQIVLAHGGSVVRAIRGGRGTTFTVTLPDRRGRRGGGGPLVAPERVV